MKKATARATSAPAKTTPAIIPNSIAAMVPALSLVFFDVGSLIVIIVVDDGSMEDAELACVLLVEACLIMVIVGIISTEEVGVELFIIVGG